ncbi:MAG TPA: hypothetical protein IAB06_07135 [Candidatus Avacidaminococcus intestinavium]|uniref:Uncharacterized protein n=1 Tax=Candidatus Avacidaminococcus intestinavium TaxID=2840684 RepID=A0A9D1MR68_9FIRM|nr:hypothetical protein [Candidatus Avacidaminococcus intestinavium]
MNKEKLKEIWQAWLHYCQRPKTIFDFKDRIKGVIILFLIIMLLEAVVELFLNWYNR